MLKKIINQTILRFSNRPKHAESQKYQKKYENIEQRLVGNPRIIDAVHSDLKKMQVPKGKESHYTSEMILKMLIIKSIEDLSWRKTIVRSENDMVLRNFIGAGLTGNIPNYSYLCGANKFIQEKTWKTVNNLLLQDAISKEEVTGEKVRVDTTLCETNIHYPTDSNLLWDSFRVLTRYIREFRELYPGGPVGYRFHSKKVKKHYTYISRNSKNKSKSTIRTCKSRYNMLMEQVRRACEASQSCINLAASEPGEIGPVEALRHYLSIVEKVLYQADQRINHGIIVPAAEKVYSIFEEHTELIKRGKAGKDVEFGHMVMIAQTGEKFISDYNVMEVKQADHSLIEPLLENHKQQFGVYPQKLAGDKGFHESAENTLSLEKDIELVCIPKKGNRTKLEMEKEHAKEFKLMQCFRAGVEGSISALKRAFGMERCLLRTFNSFASSIGCLVLSYNLVLLSKM